MRVQLFPFASIRQNEANNENINDSQFCSISTVWSIEENRKLIYCELNWLRILSSSSSSSSSLDCIEAHKPEKINKRKCWSNVPKLCCYNYIQFAYICLHLHQLWIFYYCSLVRAPFVSQPIWHECDSCSSNKNKRREKKIQKLKPFCALHFYSIRKTPKQAARKRWWETTRQP